MNRKTITCNCKACNGTQATIHANTARDLAKKDDATQATMVHNYVLMAHGPIARINHNGPQPVREALHVCTLCLGDLDRQRLSVHDLDACDDLANDDATCDRCGRERGPLHVALVEA